MSGPRMSRPRSLASYGPARGNTYLIHFERLFRHAGHYTGWTEKPAPVRFAEHLSGAGAVLTRAAAQAGIGMKLAWVWPDTTKDYEDALKHWGGASKYCPECGAKPVTPRLASGKPPPPPPPRPVSQLPRNRDGSLSRSRTTDEEKLAAGVMTSAQQAEHTELRRGAASGRVPGTERLAAVPADDPWYSAPPRQAARETATSPPDDPRRTAVMPDPSYRHQLTAEHARQAMPGLAPESGEEAHHWSPQTDATAEYDRQLDREVREADTPWARFDRAVSAAEAASARERREATRVRLAERESGQRSAAQTQLAREEAQQHVRQAMAERQAATEDACRAYARMQEETAGALSYKAEPLPRVLDSRTGGPSMAPVAATLRNGTPHSDPGLAQRGWQAQGGVYQRQPQAQLEAG